MRNIFKKSILLFASCLVILTSTAETMYVVPGQCNVPLAAGMNNAKNGQFFTWDGTTATVTTAISCNITSTAGFYYNSSSLAYTEITNASNYSSSSSASRTMRGFKITANETMTITLGSITISKVIVGGRCASNDACTLNVAGETVSTNNKNSFVKVVEGSFKNKIEIANSSGKEYNVIVYLIEGVAGPVAVSSVSLNKPSTSIEAGQSEQLTATVSPAGADDPSVTWSSSNTSVATVDQNGNVSALAPGTATITVTTTDGNKTATCTVTVTAPPAPIDVQSISMKSATTIGIGASETLTVTYNPADANINKALTWSSSNTSVATVDASGKVTGVAAGTATITATTANGKTATCSVTVQAVAVTGVSLNKTSASLQIGGSETLTATITPPDATNKDVTWESSNPAVATVNNGQVKAIAEGSATITVKTVDGNKTATCSVTVTAGPPVPQTDLATHVPEIYEAKEIAGGYGGTLTVNGGNEYEVFYFCKISNAIAVGTSPISGNIATTTDKKSFEVKGGWMKGQFNDEAEGGTSGPKEDALGSAEFQACYGDVKMGQPAEVSLHIKGYNEFAIYAYDNNTTPNSGKKRWIDVYIDDMQNPVTTGIAQSPASVRRYSISTGEHVIKLTSEYGGSKLYAISLRLPKEPRTKWLKGNDSTQVVMQTAAIKPVTYVTKYNNIAGAETKLEWIGNPANGFNLTTIPGTLTDTLLLSGNANCAVGTYEYAVVAYYNNVETSRATGKFIVASDIQATSETNVEVYQNEEMDQITFNYFALSANDVQLTWPNGQPTGISGSGNNGKYIIGGTPTAIGTYPFTITVAGADTIISGQIKVNELNYGNNPILYLYKNNLAYEKDGIHNYLTGKGKNLIARKAKEEGLRPADQYAHYKWVIISEDADANNAEVLAIIRGGANLPVLNLKGFTYTSDRLGWGEPDNGAIDTTAAKEKGCNIWIEQPNHPIFKYMTNISKNAKVKILSGYAHNGVMPIAITNAENTLCLASGRTRSIENYYAEGDRQTAIHEVPTQISGSKKYICLPLAREVQLSTQGQKLIDGIEEYLLSNAESGITPPTLEIQKFSISDIDANIDQAENTITLRLTEEKFSQLDSLRSVTPKITLADQYTHVLPSSDEKLDLRYMYVIPKTFVVTDYISRRTYDFMIELYDPYESIDQVYEAGQWVNIFDIYGRKVATTNEDIYSMILPRGMYIVVTESGKTLKIMK